MLNFKNWLLSEGGNPGSKTGLYPLGYGGIGLYPPQWYITRSADAIFYLSIDDRIYKGTDGGQFDITHIPGKSNKSIDSGDGGLWDITHIKGKPSHLKKNSSFAVKSGEGAPWKITHLPGKPTYTKNKSFIPDKGEGGIWNIKNI
jgi:hypothetical protein